MSGGGDFCFVFSTRGPEFCTEKLSRGVEILTEKVSGLGFSPRGRGEMVTGQIDTCITVRSSAPKRSAGMQACLQNLINTIGFITLYNVCSVYLGMFSI